MNDTHTFWSMVGSGTSLVIHLALSIVWIVVALTVVRRSSPQAGVLVAIASGLQMVFALVSMAVPALVGVVADRGEGGVDAYVRLFAFWSITSAVLGAGISGISLAGVVRLAQAQRRDAREGAPS